jgi:hypothetical protein
MTIAFVVQLDPVRYFAIVPRKAETLVKYERDEAGFRRKNDHEKMMRHGKGILRWISARQ